MSYDFGQISPDTQGRWHWPYAQMREGDTFKVSLFDRTRASVANATHTRARQLDKRFSVHTDGEFVVVECVQVLQRIPGLILVDWSAARAKINAVYGEDQADVIHWEGIDRPSRKDMRARTRVPDKPFLVDVGGKRFKVTLTDDRILIEPIDTIL